MRSSDGLSRRGFLQVGATAAAGVAAGPAIPAVATGADGRAPTGLLAALLDEPLGVPTGGLRLSWIVPALGPAPRQVAYQVRLSRRPDGGGVVWDSGKVAGADSTAVPYGGPDLAPSTPYWWQVRTWDDRGRISAWSVRQRIVTAATSWTGVPIWAPADPTTLADGTLDVDVTVTAVSAGLWLRAQDAADTYLWQVFAGSPGRLRTHVFRGGGFTVLGDHPLAVDVPLNAPVRISVQFEGPVIRTSIGGTLVDETTDTTYAAGTVGLRNGATESQRYQRVTFTAPDGRALLDEDFDTGPGVFAGGTVQGGELVLGPGQNVLAAIAESRDWALLRTEFELPRKPVMAAFVQATGQSPEGARRYVYKLWVNDRLAGHGPVRAVAGEARYHTHDVTAALRPGRNAMAALCHAAQDRRFLAQLVVVFADGSRQVVATSDRWRALRGAKLLPTAGFTGGGYYSEPQEYWDLRHEPVGWTAAGFDDTGWQPAATGPAFAALAPAAVNLTAVTVPPAAVTQITPGRWLVDLGSEIAGGLRLRVDGSAGTTITVQLGEERDGDGVRYQLRAGNTYREVWTLREGRQRIEHFGYRGFRWAELITDPALDLRHAVEGVALRLPWREEDSAFDCSDPNLTRVWRFTRYSIQATRLDVYQDTPTRERGPYEGDTFVNQRSEYALQRSFGLARYSNAYLCRRPTWPTEYHLMSVLSAWADYLATGDPDQLARDYDAYVAKNYDADVGPDGLVHKAPGSSGQQGADLVDWPVTNRDGYVFTQVNTVVNAFQYAAYATLAEVAAVLGRAGDAARYQGLAGRIRAAANSLLLRGDRGAYLDGAGTAHTAQHATAFPVALGLADPADLPALGPFLAGGGMRTSVYGSQFLLDALFATGQVDAAYALLTGTGISSWRHMLDDWGATIVMEAWDPSMKPNTTFSHAWGTAPANVVARHVLGVQVTGPGASRLLVRPRPGPLRWMRGRVPTIRGPVSVTVDRRGPLRAEVVLPPNTGGRIELDLAALGIDPASVRVTGEGTPPRESRVGGLLALDAVQPGSTRIRA